MSQSPPELIDMVQQLIATPSVSCVQPDLDTSNRAVIELLANWLEPLGFGIDIQQVNDAQGREKANLIATIGSGAGGLILSGHTDTVPFDGDRWNSDPFKVKATDDRLYGLGTCDMKSFFAFAIAASQSFDLGRLKQPLTIVATADEETTMAGARLLADNQQLLGRACVIGEPTGLKPIYRHKGILMESIRFIGQSGHSSNPALGNSALEAMHDFIQQLLTYRERIQQQFRDTAFEIPMPTMNLGHIHGGDNPNRICGECELQIDIRFLPGMTLEQLRADIQGIAEGVAQVCGLKVDCTSLFDGIPAMQTDAECALAQHVEAITRHKPGTVAFGTEAPFYNAMGCETIVLGPGSIDQAHQPDEFLSLDQVDPTRDILQRLIRQYCFADTPQ